MAERNTGRKLAFWGAVGLTSIIANFLLTFAAERVPSLGLARFTDYIHKGAN